LFTAEQSTAHIDILHTYPIIRSVRACINKLNGLCSIGSNTKNGRYAAFTLRARSATIIATRAQCEGSIRPIHH